LAGTKINAGVDYRSATTGTLAIAEGGGTEIIEIGRVVGCGT
jgi:hypothetical protein